MQNMYYCEYHLSFKSADWIYGQNQMRGKYTLLKKTYNLFQILLLPSIFIFIF